MTREWMSVIDSIPIDWLLESDNPPVRFFTMRELLEYRKNDSELIETKEDLCNYRVTQKILNRQNLDGSWELPNQPYLPKYKSSYWQIMLLAMFGLERTNKSVERGVEKILNFQQPEGGFSTMEGQQKEYEFVRKRGVKKKDPIPPYEDWRSLKNREMQLSCLTGNVCLALIQMGYEDHAAVKNALQWLVEIQNKDGGWLCPYWGAHKNDNHGCFMGTVPPLDAFSEVPKRLLTTSMKKALEQGAEFLLMHRLYQADHHDFSPIKKDWLLLTFPQFFYDILRGISVVTRLGHGADARIDDALRVILNKRLPAGEWPVEKTYTGTMYQNIEQKWRPSKWITLRVLKVLKNIVLTRGHLDLCQE
ncbi:MAG: hypothetical protein JW779_13115 [Candidatus Thorarchaeota archaeon]|nr:hypothetical protein [Candidatus Thorarchaeota archaeon]